MKIPRKLKKELRKYALLNINFMLSNKNEYRERFLYYKKHKYFCYAFNKYITYKSPIKNMKTTAIIYEKSRLTMSPRIIDTAYSVLNNYIRIKR